MRGKFRAAARVIDMIGIAAFDIDIHVNWRGLKNGHLTVSNFTAIPGFRASIQLQRLQ
jgi:hypothetical protein